MYSAQVVVVVVTAFYNDLLITQRSFRHWNCAPAQSELLAVYDPNDDGVEWGEDEGVKKKDINYA